MEIYSILNTIWGVLKNLWWVILPIILLRPFLFLWLWWRQERWWAGQKMILLEIKMPKEILKPLKAMEQVFSGFWGNLYDPPYWWEKWIDGKTLYFYSFEIISLGGETHFFVKIPEQSRNGVESTIYSQYPDAEISVADDYTKHVPQDIPNKEWDLWGTDYKLLKEDVYPIETYSRFFEERPEAKEEKRIDPLSSLLEGLAKLGPGEQLWIQIMASPITNEENNYVDRGREIVNRLIKRPEKEKLKPIMKEVAEGLIFGKAEEKKEEKMLWPEMMLSPGEREIVSGIENKIGKYAFESTIRFIYLGKRDRFFKAQCRTVFGFFSQFSTANLNGMKPWPRTMTKIHKYWFLPLNLIRPRRVYIRKRRLFRNYVKRLPSLFPLSGETFVLNNEELATIFHLPGRMVAPAPFVPRVEAKKGEAPPGLPTE